MKLGSELEIYALPSSQTNGDLTQISTILGLSGVDLMGVECGVKLLIDHPPVDKISAAFGGGFSVLDDVDNCIRFRVVVTRDLVRHYVARSRAHLAEKGMANRGYHKTLGVVFIGMLFRDFRDFVYLVILLANIAEFKCFPVSRAVAVQFGRAMALDRCSISWAFRPNIPSGIGLKKVELSDLLKFTMAKREDFIGTPSVSYMKALAHLSYLYDGGPRFTLHRLVWCLASIEALLNPNGRSVRVQMEDRLKVLFPGAEQKYILNEFKKLFDYRSTLVHGSLGIPFYLHDRGSIPFLDFPLEEAEFALALASKLVQLCFERNCYEFKFQLRLI